MSGLVYSHVALQQIIQRGHPAAELEAHPQAAALGAIGSLLLRYITPKDPALYDETKAAAALDSGTITDKLELQDKLLMVAYGAIIKKIQPAVRSLEALVPLLQQMRDAARAEDVDQLKALKTAFEGIDQSFLSAGGGGIEPAVEQLKKFVIEKVSVGYRPILQMTLPGPAANLVTRPELWRRYERLRWQRSGQFVQQLLAQSAIAPAGVRAAVRAYALAYRSHWSTAATSASFVNNPVGGPYRSHWWRSLWVQNAIDGWTYGFFSPSRFSGAMPGMTGNEPNPAYFEWATLQNARLDKALDVGTGRLGLTAWDDLLAGTPGTSAELQGIATAFTAAWATVYPPNSTPLLNQINPPNLNPLTADEFLRAHNGLMSVMYLLTGDHPLMSYWLQIIAPPKTMYPPPVLGGPGGGSVVPSFPSGYSPSAAGTVLGILAILALLLGWIIPAIILAVITVIVEIINASDIGDDVKDKLEELDSNLYHVQLKLQQVSLAFQDALWASGLGYPRADQLGATGPTGVTVHLKDRSTAPAYGGSRDRHLFISERSPVYPLRTNETPPPDVQFDRYPGYSGAAGGETGTGIAADWPEAGFFPDVALAGRGSVWGLLNGGATVQPVVFPFRRLTPTATSGPAFFGNAVANGIQAIQQPDAASFTDFNLDADRGYGWRCWEMQTGAAPPVSGNLMVGPAT
jgi:hypothetical protein